MSASVHRPGFLDRRIVPMIQHRDLYIFESSHPRFDRLAFSVHCLDQDNVHERLEFLNVLQPRLSH
jgi:hypothetical protein